MTKQTKPIEKDAEYEAFLAQALAVMESKSFLQKRPEKK